MGTESIFSAGSSQSFQNYPSESSTDQRTTPYRPPASRTVDALNTYSESILDIFEYLGEKLNRRGYRGETSTNYGTETGKLAIGSTSNSRKYLFDKQNEELAKIIRVSDSPKVNRAYVERINPSKLRPDSFVDLGSKTLSYLDAATNVGGVLVEFSRDRKAGRTDYKNTMTQVFDSTARVATGYAVGTAAVSVGSSIATAIGAGAVGTVALPAVLAVGAGLAGGYAIGKGISWAKTLF